MFFSYKKWTKAKDLTKYSSKDLVGILGTNDIENKLEFQTENEASSAKVSNSTEKLQKRKETTERLCREYLGDMTEKNCTENTLEIRYENEEIIPELNNNIDNLRNKRRATHKPVRESTKKAKQKNYTENKKKCQIKEETVATEFSNNTEYSQKKNKLIDRFDKESTIDTINTATDISKINYIENELECQSNNLITANKFNKNVEKQRNKRKATPWLDGEYYAGDMIEKNYFKNKLECRTDDEETAAKVSKSTPKSRKKGKTTHLLNEEYTEDIIEKNYTEDKLTSRNENERIITDFNDIKQKSRKKKKATAESNVECTRDMMKTAADITEKCYTENKLEYRIKNEAAAKKTDCEETTTKFTDSTVEPRKKKKATHMSNGKCSENLKDITKISENQTSRLNKIKEFMESVSNSTETNDVQDIIKNFEKKKDELLEKYRKLYALKYLNSANENDASIYYEIDGNELDVKTDEKLYSSVIIAEKPDTHRALSKAERIVKKAKLLKKIQNQEITLDFKGSNLCKIKGYGNQKSGTI